MFALTSSLQQAKLKKTKKKKELIFKTQNFKGGVFYFFFLGPFCLVGLIGVGDMAFLSMLCCGRGTDRYVYELLCWCSWLTRKISCWV